MKKRLLTTIAAFGIFACAASAQITVRNVTVTGTNTTVTSAFVITINSDDNTVQIDVDNTLLGVGGVTGTITSLGFDTPFTDAQLGTNGSNISNFTISFTQLNSGDNPSTGDWSIFEPYNLSQGGGVYAQILGAGTGNGPEGGNPASGIEFGEKATLKFWLPDFTEAQVAGFFDTNMDLTARWQQVNAGSGSDYGAGNGIPPEEEPPVVPVPEPSTYGLMAALSLAGLAFWRRKAARKAA
jgi:hypothetical protein